MWLKIFVAPTSCVLLLETLIHYTDNTATTWNFWVKAKFRFQLANKYVCNCEVLSTNIDTIIIYTLYGEDLKDLFWIRHLISDKKVYF